LGCGRLPDRRRCEPLHQDRGEGLGAGRDQPGDTGVPRYARRCGLRRRDARQTEGPVALRSAGALHRPNGDRPFFAYSTNYLVDLENAVIIDVEATAPIRQAEAGAALDMIDRARERFGLYPEKLVADAAYGSAEVIGWLVESEGIEPHIPVIDKSQRKDGTFSRDDFTFDAASDSYTCPGGKKLLPSRRAFQTIRSAVKDDATIRYRASKTDCETCVLKAQCCPKAPARKVTRSIHEGARDLAREITQSDAYVASSYARKKVEMLFAHLKRIIGLSRLRLRGPNGAKDEFLLAATVQNLRKLAMTVPSPA
jgi:hypothetical protein